MCGLAVADWGLRFPARQRHAAHDAQRLAALGMTAASRSLSRHSSRQALRSLFTHGWRPPPSKLILARSGHHVQHVPPISPHAELCQISTGRLQCDGLLAESDSRTVGEPLCVPSIQRRPLHTVQYHLHLPTSHGDRALADDRDRLHLELRSGNFTSSSKIRLRSGNFTSSSKIRRLLTITLMRRPRNI